MRGQVSDCGIRRSCYVDFHYGLRKYLYSVRVVELITRVIQKMIRLREAAKAQELLADEREITPMTIA